MGGSLAGLCSRGVKLVRTPGTYDCTSLALGFAFPVQLLIAVFIIQACAFGQYVRGLTRRTRVEGKLICVLIAQLAWTKYCVSINLNLFG